MFADYPFHFSPPPSIIMCHRLPSLFFSPICSTLYWVFFLSLFYPLLLFIFHVLLFCLKNLYILGLTSTLVSYNFPPPLPHLHRFITSFLSWNSRQQQSCLCQQVEMGIRACVRAWASERACVRLVFWLLVITQLMPLHILVFVWVSLEHVWCCSLKGLIKGREGEGGRERCGG